MIGKLCPKKVLELTVKLEKREKDDGVNESAGHDWELV